MSLPPGQHRVDGFPRFGTHLARRPPSVPADPAIEIRGAVAESFAVPLTDLATLPRRRVTADVEPAIHPGKSITHLVFGGLDGFRTALPAWALRPLYRLLTTPIAFLSSRGSAK